MSFVVRDMSVSYEIPGGLLTALENIDLQTEPCEFVTIIGPSGCGKSTLLHSLGGLLPQYRGTIEFDGKPIAGPDPRRAAFVFQDYSLLPWRTVLDNVAIGLKFAGVARGERRAKAADLLRMIGLSDFAESYPDELSGGMQQRVAVARALAMDPQVLLMDEPFGALDEITRRDLGFEISALLTEAQRSVVMVTHSLDEAIFWGDRVIVMSPRPARIVREFKVPRERPRDMSFIGEPAFAEIRSALFGTVSQMHSGMARSAGQGGLAV